MTIVLLLLLVFILFAFVVFIGAPYLPTLSSQQRAALTLLQLKKGSTVLDVGSGDGRMLLAAARNGYKAIGIEVNPLLVIISKIICFKYRKDITIIWSNMWTVDWPEADGIYVFLHTRFMDSLYNKIEREYKGKNVNVVSYAFEIPHKKPLKKQGPLYLYTF